MKLFPTRGERGVLGTLGGLLPLALLAHSPFAAAQAAPPDGAVYDYIVIGSGPGGGVVASNLAKAGYSVLILEAGDNNPGQGFGRYTPTVTWDFYVKHYPEGDPRDNQYSHMTWLTPQGRYWVGQSGAPAGSTLLGVYYPRGATLGGSTMINAMVCWLPSDSDWNYHAEVTGDDSWRAENMHKIFTKIEKNNYATRGTANHGFDGFFQTNMGSMTQHRMMGGLTGNTVMGAYANDWGLSMSMSDLLIRDPNEIGPDRDQTSSIYGLVTHQYANGNRYSSRNYIQETVQSGANLTVSLTSLATKVLFDTTSRCSTGDTPRATGVEYLFGRSLYKGDSRRAANAAGTKRTAIARREVIVSGGAFNSPQLLMLSGIGNATELAKFNIPVIKDLPGVGQNLMDNQEMPIVGTGNAGSGMAGVAMYKTKHPAHGERDMFLMGGQGFLFRGFWPDNPVRVPSEPFMPYGVSMVKGSSVNNKGWVKLRSADPMDTPEINFNHYAEGAEYDLEAMKDTVAWIRKVYQRVGITTVEPPCSSGPDADGYCGKEDEDWIHKQTFGHHPTSTNKIGADDDPMAVLDSKFRVRGVSGLRVVDASSFARIPGVFPAVSTFMISQKASDDMLAELSDDTALPQC
ncbi:Choline dehydrogenase, mitochondrial [Madurella mycetomatis]|uniref:Choline dehydrogenase, mitochondrial n=1 Tax=Madurella mycetomatis TaxID=100816 RepID=A0A175W2W6_9PEZI|nr:Choline dehydrogenase, mitochondrial [Madurella mycetomatis]